MTHRNRVLPTGEIAASSYRGAWMGNRGGPLATRAGRRQWATRAWIYCHLDFNGRERVFRQPGRRYTELFFLDEAHALAAGHRPCGQCQFHRLREFTIAAGHTAATRAGDLDTILHAQRTGPREQAHPSSLPDGTFILVGERPTLLWNGRAFYWSPSTGYRPTPTPDAAVPVLTPPLIRTALAAGYRITVPALSAARTGDE